MISTIAIFKLKPSSKIFSFLTNQNISQLKQGRNTLSCFEGFIYSHVFKGAQDPLHVKILKTKIYQTMIQLWTAHNSFSAKFGVSICSGLQLWFLWQCNTLSLGPNGARLKTFFSFFTQSSFLALDHYC